MLTCTLVVSGCADAEVTKRNYLEQGDAHMAAGRAQEAIIQYRNAIKTDPRFGEAHFKLAEAYAKTQAFAQAAKSYIIAAELLPDSLDAQVKAATVRLLAEDFQGARTYAEAALKIDPKDIQAQVILANSLAGLKDVSAALRQLEDAIQLAPGDARPYTSLAAIHVSQGDRVRAEEAFRKAVAAEPTDPMPRISLGYYMWALGRTPDAKTELEKAVQLDQNSVPANRMLALFYISQNRVEDAETPLIRLANQKDERAMQTLADLYIRTNRPEKAITLLDTLKESQGAAKTFAISRLAQIDYAAGRKPAAHATLAAALKEEETNAELLALQARWLAGERKTEDALVVAKKAVVAAPENPIVQYTLGLVHAARLENEEAIRAFTETLRLNPRANAAELQLSRLLLLQGNVNEGLAHARAVVKAAPGSVDGRVQLATALLGRQDLAAAEAEVKTLLKQYPENAAVHSLQGYLLAKRGDSAGAIRALDRALELNPGNLHALNGRLSIDLYHGRLAEARARLQKALERGPRTSTLLVLAARLENTAKDYPAAEKYLRQAIDLEPDDMTPYTMLGQMYVRQNRLDEARRELEAVTKRRPDNVAARTMIGIILEAQGKMDESRQVYEGIVSTTSRAPVAANNLAYIYAERGERLNEALTLAQTAKEQMPNSHEVNDTLGWVYYKKDMAQMAVIPLESSVEVDPKNPLYHYHLGLAYAKAGQTAKARQSLEQALELGTNFAGADDARATLASLKE